MYKALLLLTIILCSTYIQAQQCITDKESAMTEPVPENTNYNVDTKKLVRINYHFMLRSNGTGNFTEVDDGDGENSYTGYDFAEEHTAWMNWFESTNPKMHLPVGNSTDNPDKNFSYVVDAVYFHRNDATFASTGPMMKSNNVLNIFLVWETNSNYTYSTGYAVGWSNPNTRPKYTVIKHIWQTWKALVKTNSRTINDFHFIDGRLTHHELAHLYGLSHTMVHNYYGTPCESGCSGGVVDLSCGDDGCADTPSAWDIACGNGHPACGWGDEYDPNCTNNMMDYTGGLALTPCQISKVHSSLEGGMKSFLVCDAVSQDLDVLDPEYPDVSYYGKKLRIGNDTATLATINAREKMNFYYSEEVSFENFAVEGEDLIPFHRQNDNSYVPVAKLEVFFVESCN